MNEFIDKIISYIKIYYEKHATKTKEQDSFASAPFIVNGGLDYPGDPTGATYKLQEQRKKKRRAKRRRRRYRYILNSMMTVATIAVFWVALWQTRIADRAVEDAKQDRIRSDSTVSRTLRIAERQVEIAERNLITTRRDLRADFEIRFSPTENDPLRFEFTNYGRTQGDMVDIDFTRVKEEKLMDSVFDAMKRRTPTYGVMIRPNEGVSTALSSRLLGAQDSTAASRRKLIVYYVVSVAYFDIFRVLHHAVDGGQYQWGAPFVTTYRNKYKFAD